jgi:hypothetical protein
MSWEVAVKEVQTQHGNQQGTHVAGGGRKLVQVSQTYFFTYCSKKSIKILQFSKKNQKKIEKILRIFFKTIKKFRKNFEKILKKFQKIKL